MIYLYKEVHDLDNKAIYLVCRSELKFKSYLNSTGSDRLASAYSK